MPEYINNITPNNTFNKIDATKSIAIYKHLTQGKIILKNYYNEIKDELIESPLFTLIFNNPSHFSNLYQHIGYKLEFHNQGSFYYIRELTEDGIDEADNNAFRVQVILLLIGRYFAGTGRDLELLAKPDCGLDEHDISELESDNESSDILRTAHFTKGWKEALIYLCKRNFAFKTSSTSLFLSDAGMAFLTRLINEQDNENLD